MVSFGFWVPVTVDVRVVVWVNKLLGSDCGQGKFIIIIIITIIELAMCRVCMYHMCYIGNS